MGFHQKKQPQPPPDFCGKPTLPGAPPTHKIDSSPSTQSPLFPFESSESKPTPSTLLNPLFFIFLPSRQIGSCRRPFGPVAGNVVFGAPHDPFSPSSQIPVFPLWTTPYLDRFPGEILLVATRPSFLLLPAEKFTFFCPAPHFRFPYPPEFYGFFFVSFPPRAS